MAYLYAAPFGSAGGTPAREYWLVNARGTRLALTDYGARVTHLLLPGEGGAVDAVLGYDSAEGYAAGDECFGAVCGRYANRLRGAAFSLGSQRFQLDKNDGENTLHGGGLGFHRRFFEIHPDNDGLLCTLTSPDGDMGFPGTLTLTVRYTLTDADVLRIEYDAVCPEADTVVNLTNHSYFNLDGGGSVLGHRLSLSADFYTPNDGQTLPTGEIRSVSGTCFDLRSPIPLGTHIEGGAPALRPFSGYDHNFVLRKPQRDVLSHAASLFSPGGRVMECWTTLPGLQLYTGNFLRVPNGRGGRSYGPYAGLCLEAQRFPDAMTYPHFQSPILRRGERYQEITEYRFFQGGDRP